jgi:hypothetical protein
MVCDNRLGQMTCSSENRKIRDPLYIGQPLIPKFSIWLAKENAFHYSQVWDENQLEVLVNDDQNGTLVNGQAMNSPSYRGTAGDATDKFVYTLRH